MNQPWVLNLDKPTLGIKPEEARGQEVGF